MLLDKISQEKSSYFRRSCACTVCLCPSWSCKFVELTFFFACELSVMWLHIYATLPLQLSNVEQQQKTKKDVKTVMKNLLHKHHNVVDLDACHGAKGTEKTEWKYFKNRRSDTQIHGDQLFRTDLILTKRKRDFLQSPYWQRSWPALKSNSTTTIQYLTISVCVISPT